MARVAGMLLTAWWSSLVSAMNQVLVVGKMDDCTYAPGTILLAKLSVGLPAMRHNMCGIAVRKTLRASRRGHSFNSRISGVRLSFFPGLTRLGSVPLILRQALQMRRILGYKVATSRRSPGSVHGLQRPHCLEEDRYAGDPWRKLR